MAKLRRSQLATPANKYQMIEKSAESHADQVFLDLEDSVPPGERADARENVEKAMKELDWGEKTVSVRINPVDKECWLEDVTSVAGSGIDTIILPKVSSEKDVYALEKVLNTIQDADEIGLEPQIEDGEALHNVMEIAGASERNQSLIFGPGDYSASTGIPGLSIGSSIDYDGHRWHHALAEINAAAKAHNLDCIDGPFADVDDLEGYRRSARNARGIGCDGKWVIHPSQIPVANEVFAPDQETVEEASKVLERYREASEDGKGAIQVDGKLVDEATIKMAENIVDKNREIEEMR